jgi:lysophospholipase L1-like esterase
LPQKLRSTVFALAAIVLPFIALFACIEAGFQITDALRRKPATADTDRGKNVYDPDLLYRPRVLPHPGPKGSAARVVILGDSLVGGPPGSNLVDRSQRIVNQKAKFPASEWINTGVPGYTNYQELVYLKKFGLSMQPDVVGVVFCLNDVHQYLAEVKVENGRLVGAGVTGEAADAAQGGALRLARRACSCGG